MNDEQRYAYVLAQIACMNAEIAGMQALNAHRIHRGETIAYLDDAFIEVINRYGLGHNAVITTLLGDTP